MPSGHEVTCRIAVLRDIHRRPQPETVAITIEDEGSGIVCLQGTPCDGGKGN